jgi:hypothetical protein
MLDLSWGGYHNGYIPDSAMSPIDNQGHRLEHTAAAEFLAMQAAMLHDLGRTITVAPGDDSAFRTIAQQQADYDLYLHGGNVASAPGLSNHGWGRAVDITGYEVHDDVWAWLLAHAAAYGYSHATGALSGERWHWESTNAPSAVAGGNATPIPNQEVPDMDATQAAQLAAIYNTLNPVAAQLAAIATNQKETTVDSTLTLIQIGQADGTQKWALTGPGYWVDVDTQTEANQLSLKYGHQVECTDATWAAFKTASGK